MNAKGARRRNGNALGAPRRRAVVRLLLWVGFLLALSAAVAAALSGLGHRWGWWHFTTGFSMLRWAIYAALAGLALSAVGFLAACFLLRWRLMIAAVPGIAVALAVVAVPLAHLQRAQDAPPIHDITTDMEDPPAFAALYAKREASPNAADYVGEPVAREQRQAYPDIQPLSVGAPPDEVFEAALDQAQSMGWRLAASEREEGRIEAVATSFWYGFEDDVVVRLREAEDGGTRVDVRSASRVGVGDMGVNAQRIRAFLRGLRNRLDSAAARH